MDSYRLSQGNAQREQMAMQVGVDGFYLLKTVHAKDAPA
jgi:hypothetical protein